MPINDLVEALFFEYLHKLVGKAVICPRVRNEDFWLLSRGKSLSSEPMQPNDTQAKAAPKKQGIRRLQVPYVSYQFVS